MVLFFYENILTKAVVIHTGKFCKLHGKKLKLKGKKCNEGFSICHFFFIWLFNFVFFCSPSWGQFYNFPVLIYLHYVCFLQLFLFYIVWFFFCSFWFLLLLLLLIYYYYF